MYLLLQSLTEVAMPVSKIIVLPASGFLEILYLYVMSLLCKGKYWYDFIATKKQCLMQKLLAKGHNSTFTWNACFWDTLKLFTSFKNLALCRLNSDIVPTTVFTFLHFKLQKIQLLLHNGDISCW